MGLTKEALNVLKICELEPGNANAIALEAKIKPDRIEEILKRLKSLNLVYSDSETAGNLWGTTPQGIEQLKKAGLI